MTQTDIEEMKEEAARVAKLDMGVIASVSISVITFAFGVGLYFGTILEQGRRIEELERGRTEDRKEISVIKETVIQIDANVRFLAERAGEDRRRIYGQ
jgi:hypothetical protein